MTATTDEHVEATPHEEKSASVDDLAAAYKQEGRPHFGDLRLVFEREHGEIVKYYFVPGMAVGAVLVRLSERRRSLDNTFQIMVAQDGSLPTTLAEQVRTVLHEKHQLANRLQGRARDVLVHDAYSLVVYLLAFAVPTDDPPERTALDATVKAARQDLRELRRSAKVAARRIALWYYLVGLLPGVVTAAGLSVVASLSAHSDAGSVATCLAGGAVGAIVSVMVRVTRGTTLDIDANRGRRVTILAGAFRPVIGAVFGAVLFVLTRGGLLPFATPPEGAESTCFFIGLAFLAGFSERWAQDTIVNSAPKIPPARRTEPPSDTDAF